MHLLFFFFFCASNFFICYHFLSSSNQVKKVKSKNIKDLDLQLVFKTLQAHKVRHGIYKGEQIQINQFQHFCFFCFQNRYIFKAWGCIFSSKLTGNGMIFCRSLPSFMLLLPSTLILEHAK